MSAWTPSTIMNDAERQAVHFIRLAFTDMNGFFKNVEVPIYQLEKVLNNETMFDGSSISGFADIESSDMYLHPDLSTWTVFEGTDSQQNVAFLICNIHDADGRPFAGDPRGRLVEKMNQLTDEGFTDFNLGAEAEFYLFKLDENGRPTLETNDQGFYFDMNPTDQGEACRRDIVMQLEALGYAIEAHHHECGLGQHEINFKFSSAVEACDRIQIFKWIVKTTAPKYGLHASFMPKPLFKDAGNGMHCNLSLMAEDHNAFCDDSTDLGLSSTAMQFMAGILDHAPALTAIANPIVNSYKRLVPGFEAPVYIAWSAQNRTPLIRIPATRGMGSRIELRSVDPAANPYLTLTVLLQAGLDGIHRQLDPGPAVDENIFHMSPHELKHRQIEQLPATLGEAIKALEADDTVLAALGDHIASRFIQEKKAEFHDYEMQVTQWEIDRYFNHV